MIISHSLIRFILSMYFDNNQCGSIIIIICFFANLHYNVWYFDEMIKALFLPHIDLQICFFHFSVSILNTGIFYLEKKYINRYIFFYFPRPCFTFCPCAHESYVWIKTQHILHLNIQIDRIC